MLVVIMKCLFKNNNLVFQFSSAHHGIIISDFVCSYIDLRYRKNTKKMFLLQKSFVAAVGSSLLFGGGEYPSVVMGSSSLRQRGLLYCT